MRCANCGLEVSHAARFCSECGKALTIASGTVPTERSAGVGDRVATAISAANPERSVTAERRHLTVMFCDLVGVGELSNALDPEELLDLVRAFHEYCSEIIARFDGHVAQFLGDGMMVYFGYPAAFEDNAERAVRASLRIIEDLPTLVARIAHPLQVRVGIHTGLVVVGRDGVFGETPNIAARIQSTAEPGTIAVSAATFELIEGLFKFDPLEPQTFKGASGPLDVYRVLDVSDATSRFDVAIKAGLTRMVGRGNQLAQLLAFWDRARAGEGNALLLRGETGIGKSRMAAMLKDRAAAGNAIIVEARCSPYYRDTLFRSIAEPVSRRLGLAAAGLRDERAIEPLIDAVLAESARAPMLMIFEDLHWADASTLELLDALISRIAHSSVMLLMTARQEFAARWPLGERFTELTLERLSPTDAAAMVANVADGEPLPAPGIDQIVARADGVPLFIEELTRAAMRLEPQRGAAGDDKPSEPPPLAIPASLHDSLIARLDRLGPNREIAQVGAVIGREFPSRLIEAVASLDRELLRGGLARLVEADILVQEGDDDQAVYSFRHSLIRDAAYDSLLKSSRRLYHQRIALALEGNFPELAERQPELIARHYREAGLPSRR